MSDKCQTQEVSLVATVTMRELVRDSKRVFDDLEAEGVPIVVTRNGRPFAALMPIDQEQAEALLIASTPEIIDTQRKAEQVIAAGAAKPLSEALEEVDSDQLTSVSAEPLSSLECRLGSVRDSELAENLAEEIFKTTQLITGTTLESVAKAQIRSRPSDAWIQRITHLNELLISISFQNELCRTLPIEKTLATPRWHSSSRKKAEGLEILRADEAMAAARTIVTKLNFEILENSTRRAPDEFEDIFETELRGGVAFARSYAMGDHDLPDILRKRAERERKQKEWEARQIDRARKQKEWETRQVDRARKQKELGDSQELPRPR